MIDAPRVRALYSHILSAINPPYSFSRRDQISFFKRLSLLISSGIPLGDCLCIIKNQASSQQHKIALEKIYTHALEGKSLSTSLQRLKMTIDPLTLCLIRIGETNGILEKNLLHIAQELKKREEVRQKLIAALIYPALIVSVTVIITLFIITYLFPKVLPIVQSLHVSLPWSTRILLFFFTIFRVHGLSIILGCIGGASLGYVLLRHSASRRFIDRWILSLPVVSILLRNYNMSLFSRNMGILLFAGTPLVVSIHETTTVLRNAKYHQIFQALEQEIISGKRISSHLELHSPYIPLSVVQMIAVGEKTGELAASFLYIAQLCEDELDESVRTLSSLIEPILMILIGLIVGFVALSIITPIYGITQYLYPR